MAKRRKKSKKAGAKVCVLTRKHRKVCGTVTTAPKKRRRKSKKSKR
jgi:hypothetical protein